MFCVAGLVVKMKQMTVLRCIDAGGRCVMHLVRIFFRLLL